MNDKDKELIKAMAEFHGYEILNTQFSDCVQVKSADGDFLYRPLTNGTQLNEFVEKAKIDIAYFPLRELWDAQKNTHYKEDKDRTKATLLCIADFLEVKWS